MNRRKFLRAAATAPLLAFGTYRETRYHEICGNCKSYSAYPEYIPTIESNVNGIPLDCGQCQCPGKYAAGTGVFNDGVACVHYRNAKCPGYEVRG